MISVSRLVTFNEKIQKDIQADGSAQYIMPWVSVLDAYLDLLGFYQIGYIDRYYGDIKVRAFCKLVFKPTHRIKFASPININIFTDDKHYAVLKLSDDNQLRMMCCHTIARLMAVIEKKEIVGCNIFDNENHNKEILARLRKERELIELFSVPTAR